MGTRHLIGIIKDGEVKLSQYGQWDGYYSGGNGEEFAKWVLENLKAKDIRQYEYRIKQFKEKVDVCKPVTDLYIKHINKVLTPLSTSASNTLEYSIPLRELIPSLSRDTSVGILDIINRLPVYEYQNRDTAFPVTVDLDTTFIEFAYVIDLDEEKVYFLTSHSFNKELVAPNCNYMLSKAVFDNYISQGLECFYTCKIKKLPSLKTLDKIIKPILGTV